jgi:hypothetical protein
MIASAGSRDYAGPGFRPMRARASAAGERRVRPDAADFCLYAGPVFRLYESPQLACACGPDRGLWRPNTRVVCPVQETTWTVTVRVRGRSSKSISTICCQVPSASVPSTSGIVSEGPISAARWWACELVSWLRRLCS